jgi:hypothetical protein
VGIVASTSSRRLSFVGADLLVQQPILLGQAAQRPVLATKRGYSVFPFSPAVVESVITELDGLDSTKGGIKFSEARLLPNAAFDALLKRRRREIDAALSKPRRR